jgi:hypothetical protein
MDSEVCSIPSNDLDDLATADHAMLSSYKIGIPTIVSPKDLCSENPRLKILFALQIFRSKPNLNMTSDPTSLFGTSEEHFLIDENTMTTHMSFYDFASKSTTTTAISNADELDSILDLRGQGPLRTFSMYVPKAVKGVMTDSNGQPLTKQSADAVYSSTYDGYAKVVEIDANPLAKKPKPKQIQVKPPPDFTSPKPQRSPKVPADLGRTSSLDSSVLLPMINEDVDIDDDDDEDIIAAPQSTSEEVEQEIEPQELPNDLSTLDDDVDAVIETLPDVEPMVASAPEPVQVPVEIHEIKPMTAPQLKPQPSEREKLTAEVTPAPIQQLKSRPSEREKAMPNDESRSYVHFINIILMNADGILTSHLPLRPHTTDIYEKIQDGLILIELLNYVRNNIINISQIHSKAPLTKAQKLENLTCVFKTLTSLQIVTNDLKPEDIESGR